MKQLIYTSTATQNVNFYVINDLLTQSVRKNNEFSISGMMIFDGKQFVQCIEGNEVDVNQLKENILNDTRHHNIHWIGEVKINKRLFTNWNMGYLNNAESIKEVFLDITGSQEYNFRALTYPKAKLILLKLSYMI